MPNRSPKVLCIFLPPITEDADALEDFLRRSNGILLHTFEEEEYAAFMDGFTSMRGRLN